MKIKENVVEIVINPINDKYSCWWIKEINNKILNIGFSDKEIGVKTDIISGYFPQRINNDVWLTLPDGSLKGDCNDQPNIINNYNIDNLKNRIKILNEKYGILKRWKANLNKHYYNIEYDIVNEKIEDNSLATQTDYDDGNYFQTKDEAEQVCNLKREFDNYFWELLDENKLDYALKQLEELIKK